MGAPPAPPKRPVGRTSPLAGLLQTTSVPTLMADLAALQLPGLGARGGTATISQHGLYVEVFVQLLRRWLAVTGRGWSGLCTVQRRCTVTRADAAKSEAAVTLRPAADLS